MILKKPTIDLEATLSNHGITISHVARVFGVSRQSVFNWIRKGIPDQREKQLEDYFDRSGIKIEYVKWK